MVSTDDRGFAPRNIYSVFQMLGQPIQDRHREHEDRPKAFEELGKKLQLYMKFLDSFKQKVYGWKSINITYLYLHPLPNIYLFQFFWIFSNLLVLTRLLG